MSLRILLGLALASAVSAYSCTIDGSISCQGDVAKTFLSIQDHVEGLNGQMEVVFLIDEGGLTPSQYYWTRQLLLSLSQIFVVAPQHTLVSIVNYGTTSRTIVPMTSRSDICSLTRNITNMQFQIGESYLAQGIQGAVTQLYSVRRPKSIARITILLTTGDWANLGGDPESNIERLKHMDNRDNYLAVMILKFPDQKLGLIRDVVTSFASYFGSNQLSFTIDMRPEYLRELHKIVKYNKAMGSYWPLNLSVDSKHCIADGRKCSVNEMCVCDVRTVLKEYICIRSTDTDPPEAVTCVGPPENIQVAPGNKSAVVSWPVSLFSDNSGSDLIVKSNMMPGLYQPGEYKVTSRASDSAGNIGSCTFRFTVQQ